MRVITGSARGRRLLTLEGEDVRPTTDRVKEAMFSAIQFEIEGRRVLDLFAGSGQLAVEALSRGAASAVLVDAARRSLAVAEKNLQATGLRERARLVNADSLRDRPAAAGPSCNGGLHEPGGLHPVRAPGRGRASPGGGGLPPVPAAQIRENHGDVVPQKRGGRIREHENSNLPGQL